MNPILKGNVKCFGSEDCYPLAFGAPAAAMVLAFLIFICGHSSYVKRPPSGNMFVKVSKCVVVRKKVWKI